jgi:hypothetical protein
MLLGEGMGDSASVGVFELEPSRLLQPKKVDAINSAQAVVKRMLFLHRSLNIGTKTPF